MTKSIYDQFDRTFSQVSAYVITFKGKKIGNISIKYPRDGAGRLYAYLYIVGFGMSRDFAIGGGYDKRSAAVGGAATKFLQKYPRLSEHRELVELLSECSGVAEFERYTHKIPLDGYAILRAI